MEVHFVEANPKVSELAGKCAVTRGPIVYCMESIDNGEQLWDIRLCGQGRKQIVSSEVYAVPTLEISANRRPAASALYQLRSDRWESFTAKLIPYFAFANRGVCDMQIWTMVE